MSTPCTVVIGAAELLETIRQNVPDDSEILTFGDTEPLKALEAITARRPNVIAMWVGETDGSSWRALEKLPAVSDTIDPRRFSALAVRDGRVRLAVPVSRDWRRRVVLFARDTGRWTVRSDDVVPVSYCFHPRGSSRKVTPPAPTVHAEPPEKPTTP